ncbi:MAG: tetratricopeptide repeat protein [Anaerolineae bacterium]|nr:tetratricopeptide repeat protein [Anaerolineae bacterium]
MAGNREAYDQAMNAGHNAAWEQDWVTAVASYGRAIQEFPSDVEAHLALGFGLLEAGRLEDALRVYTRAHQLVEADPIPLEKSADILERLGRLREAADQYINVADLYLAQRDLNKAIDNWERATRLSPGLINIHIKLAQAYERIGDKRQAIRHYLILAYNFQRVEETDKAIRACQRALRLDKNSPLVLNTLRALEAGNPITMPPDDDDRGAGRGNNLPPPTKTQTGQAEAVLVENNPLGPMGEAMTEAMSMLATHVVEAGLMDMTGASALQALEAQRQDMVEEAIDAYLKAEPRLKHPALKLNLGVLLVLKDKPEEATRHLSEAINQPALAVGAYQALGLAYKLQGKYRQSVKWLIQCLQAVDSAQALTDEDTVNLTLIYERIGAALERQNEEVLTAASERFKLLLEGTDWKHRVPETRRQFEETLRDQGEQGVIDIIVAQHGDRLTTALEHINRYMRQNMLTMAMDEAHFAVEYSPLYLPIHERMAEILLSEGRVRQAIAKYNVIASVYMARGDNSRAARILNNILEMAPLDLTVRKNLIDLLEDQENWQELVGQYVGLADTYNQLGDSDQARETYSLAERTAAQIGAAPEVAVDIKHKVADLEQLRLEFKRAQKVYEEIIQLAPNDERAYRQLIDLQHRQGNRLEATRRLDDLLRIYARNKDIPKIMRVLEELVRTYPNDTGARSRLAAIYKQLGRIKDAITQLDALGEIQLEAGLHQEAAATIKQIISFNPPNIEDYQRLLGQLGG